MLSSLSAALVTALESRHAAPTNTVAAAIKMPNGISVPSLMTDAAPLAAAMAVTPADLIGTSYITISFWS